MSKEQPVNFMVTEIEPANGTNFFRVVVKFDNSSTLYPYIRKCGRDSNGNHILIISGCRVTFHQNPFDDKYVVDSITREYDVRGYKRKSTVSQSKKYERLKKKAIEPRPSKAVGDENEEPKKVEEVEEEPTEEKVEEPKEEELKLPKKVRHEKYETIRACLDSNIPIYLAGPAGSGKNYTVEQIARENGWNFYYTNSVQQEYKLTGFIDAGGTYQETEFYKACIDNEECIFFLDEMDASVPEALVLINAAIANGYFEFPNGRVTLGNVHFVAAGNTVGSGADELYTGRMVLDQATLDRFAIIEFDYSLPIELKLTKGNRELVNFVRSLREKAKSNGIRATFSYRCLTMVSKLEETKLSMEEILTITVLKGMDKDTINTLRVYGTNKYYKALSAIQNGY